LVGPVFDTIPDLIFYGEQPGSQFGRSVAGGKDINGIMLQLESYF
jgi:hypothetical protein